MSSQTELIKGWLKQAGCQKIRESGIDHLVSSCPFHKDQYPSFSINTANGLFLCYSGGCAMSGNLINFLMAALGWSFKKAKEASQLVDVPDLDDESLWRIPSYERKRAELVIENKMIREGHLGMYQFIPHYMLERGYPKRLLQRWEVGYDYGSRRVTIPVRDGKGELIGISKRSTFDGQMPKYLHLGFRKSNYLYGAHRCLNTRRVVVVEGQLDVIAWYGLVERFGMNLSVCVSTMGSRVSQTQIDLLSRFPEVILALDNDVDGAAAMRRIGDGLVGRMKPNSLLALRSWPKGCKDIGDLFEREVTQEQFMRFWNRQENYLEIE
jgi:DNA primase